MESSKSYQTIVFLLAVGVGVYLFFPNKYILWIVVLLGVFSVLYPPVAAGIHKTWFWVGETLGKLTGKILLSIIYLLLIVPFSYWIRNKLGINLKKRSKSYFIVRNHKYVKDDLMNIW